MNDAAAEIERIVRQVLAELQASGAAPKAGANVASKVQASQAPEEGCTIPDRVITLATLEGRMNGAAVIRVPRGAVVTPAVKDELRARNIRLEFGEAAQPSGPKREQTLIVGIADIADDVVAVTSAMQAHAAGLAKVQTLQNTELKELVRRMSEFIGGGESRGVVLSRRPAAAACLANRFENIRAVWVCTPRALSEAIQTMNPNVITYNPGHHKGFAQRSLLQAFLLGAKVGRSLRE